MEQFYNIKDIKEQLESAGYRYWTGNIIDKNDQERPAALDDFEGFAWLACEKNGISGCMKVRITNMLFEIWRDDSKPMDSGADYVIDKDLSKDWIEKILAKGNPAYAQYIYYTMKTNWTRRKRDADKKIEEYAHEVYKSILPDLKYYTEMMSEAKIYLEEPEKE